MVEQADPKSNSLQQNSSSTLHQANCESPMTPINEPSVIPQRPGSCDEAVRSTGPGSHSHTTDTARRIMSDKPRQRKEDFHVEEYYVKDMNQSDQNLETRYIYKFDPGLCPTIYIALDISIVYGPYIRII